MNSLLRDVAGRLVAGDKQLVTPEEAVAIAHLPLSDNPDIFALASMARGMRQTLPVFSCAIINARSGRCPENCAFCAQSAHHNTNAPVYGLVDTDTLLRHAEEMVVHGVRRCGIVTSGTTLSDKDLDRLCESARKLGERVPEIALCGSLGLLTREKARRLKEAGFSSYHHNLETARSHFDAICTTHAYDADLETLAIAKEAGFRVCSFGIFGLGETWEQRVELLLTVRDARVDSLPLNFLSPVKGTRMENMPLLAPAEALRCIAIARLVNPEKDILVCGGRLSTLGDGNSWIFAAGANGVMTGDYLTTRGCGYDEDDALFRYLGIRS